MQNQDSHSSQVRSTEQRYAKIQNSAPFACGKTWQWHKKSKIFSKKNNAMSAHFVPNRPTCRKKSILAKVCCDAKKGQCVNATK